MKAFLSPRFFCLLLVAAALALRAQDHIDYDAPTPAMAKFQANAAAEKDAPTPAPGQFKGKGGGRGKGGGAAAGAAGAAGAAAAPAGFAGRGGVSPADLAMDLEKIIANPAELAKGQKIYETQCVTCHGPKGEGDRGPTLAQPDLARAPDNPTLMQIVSRGIPNTEMVGGRLKPGEAPYLAAYVRSLGRIPMEKVPGDPAHGKELFNTKGACLTCHTLEGKGTSAIGPDLGGIGSRRSANFLRRALTDPGADVPQTYTPVRADISMPTNFAFIKVKTKDGKEYSGVRINESTFSVQFRDMTGAMWSFRKADLAEFSSGKGSPMPVYAGLFTPDEMNDVIAYLASLRGKKM